MLKCRNRETGDVVALKKFKSCIDGENEDAAQVRKTALREVKLLRALSHPNIVTLLDVFRQGGKLYLCFEYLEKTGGCWRRGAERGGEGMRVLGAACWVLASLRASNGHCFGCCQEIRGVKQAAMQATHTLRQVDARNTTSLAALPACSA